jgi:hypothetical protein
VLGFSGFGISDSYTLPIGYNGVYITETPSVLVPASATTNGTFNFSLANLYQAVPPYGAAPPTTGEFGGLLISGFVAPVVAVPPQSQTVLAGQTATLSVVAEGDHSMMTYQWLLNGTNVAGATNSTLTLSNFVASEAGIYTVAVTNSIGFTISPPATLSTGYAIVASGSGSGLTLSWPTSAAGYVLQSATTLTQPVTWNTVTNVPSTNGPNCVMTLPVSPGGSVFYRLMHP